jgi:broad specificity phosphatase PhoE
MSFGGLIMKLIMVRHGEPNYKPCEERNFLGHGMELAPLSFTGIEQAKNVAQNKLFNNAEIILSSPYPRALQTATYIAIETKLDVIVEMDLREWQPDLTFQCRSHKDASNAYKDYRLNNGLYPANEKRNWETTQLVLNRATECLNRYSFKYRKIIVVAHGELIRCLAGGDNVDYCGVVEFDFN